MSDDEATAASLKVAGNEMKEGDAVPAAAAGNAMNAQQEESSSEAPVIAADEDSRLSWAAPQLGQAQMQIDEEEDEFGVGGLMDIDEEQHVFQPQPDQQRAQGVQTRKPVAEPAPPAPAAKAQAKSASGKGAAGGRGKGKGKGGNSAKKGILLQCKGCWK